MKNFFRKILSMPLKFFLRVFFEDRFLKGKYFDNCFVGYRWALRSIWLRNILRIEKPLPWPASSTCIVSESKNIIFHPDDLHIFQVPGIYFQNFKAIIVIGRGCYIAPNVGLITANHNIIDLDLHTEGKGITLGDKCWIGMNSVILPGVILGERTIVAANSVVTKSFEQGNVILAGSPARVIKVIN
ncbi:MAG: acyltransferase [Alishewanella aestuarii]